MPEISVIVPMYNSEKTIDLCLKSIGRQTCPDYELIICDDGSVDGSIEICRQYARIDKRIKILSLPHRGVSAARNAGLDIAGGCFIAFADSDDMPESTWLEELRKPFKDGKRGLSICGYTVVDGKGRKLYGTEYREETRRAMVLTPQKMLEDLFSNRLYYQGYVWNKMFERSILETEPVLRFDESIYYNEDRLFAFHYLLRCPAIYYSGISHYKYRASRKRERYHSKYLTEMKAFEIMFKEVKSRKWERAGFYLEKDMLRAATELYELIGEADHQQDRKYLEKVLWKERETIYHE